MPPVLESSSMARPRLSDHHKRRLEVFVEIPPSPAHIARLTPKNTPKSSLKTTAAETPLQSALQVTPNSLKRKLDVYVEIPPSPLHRTTPVQPLRTAGADAMLRRRSQVYVEIPASPLSIARMKDTLNNGMRASPLSTKAFNSNTHIDSPYKKRKLSDTTKQTKQGDEDAKSDSYPNGYFYCHQCRKKCDNTFGLRCTTLSGIRCKSKYCKPCLRNRYGLDIELIMHRGVTQSNKHFPGETYHWTCPKCADNCNCVNCRKSKGLPPTGKFAVRPQMAGTNASSQAAMMNSFFKADGSSTAIAPSKAIKRTQLDQPQPRAPRAKKPVREPKWTAVPTELSRLQVEDRFFLREFVLRFSPLMPRIGVTHLEELDLFHTLSRPCGKALVHGLLDLIAADAEPEEQKLIREVLKKISSAGLSPAALWARLDILRSKLPSDFFVVPIPDPADPPSSAEEESEDEDDPPQQRTSSRINARRNAKNAIAEDEVLDLNNGVTHAVQLLPPIIALCECALQGASVRAELDEGSADARGENRAYFANVRKENERWAEERVSLGWGEGKEKEKAEEKVDEKGNINAKKGKAKGKDVENGKAYRTALATHKATLATLENAHMVELQGTAPRFGPLGRDSQGRVYYAASARRAKNKRSKPKMPEDEDRAEFRKWGWFLAVRGRGGMAGGKEERWWGFSDPVEVQQLAKWLAAAEGVDGKDSVVEGPAVEPVKGKVDLANAQTGSGATAGITSGAVVPPGSTGVEVGEESDESSMLGENEGHKMEDEEFRLILNGGAGIPIGPDGVPRPLLPPIAPQHAGRKCLVLDLDETLVYSSFEPIQHADYVIPVKIEYHWYNVYVIKRPGVDSFLKKMGEIYEVVVFTASLSRVADPVLDKLDIHNVVTHRLFRESCYNHRGNYVKDLSQLGRPIEDTIILDNSPASYIFHPNNAVPVSSWSNDPHDTELLDLCPFLADLATVDNIRSAVQCPPSRADVKTLVKGLGDFADLLTWRLAGGESPS